MTCQTKLLASVLSCGRLRFEAYHKTKNMPPHNSSALRLSPQPVLEIPNDLSHTERIAREREELIGIEEETEYSFLAEQYLEIEDMLESIKNCYEWRDQETVVHFLEDNPRLLQLLCEAPEVVRSIFGDDARMALEFMDCSNVPGEVDQLHLLVHTPAGIEEMGEMFYTFDHTWWNECRKQVQGKLNILPEFD